MRKAKEKEESNVLKTKNGITLIALIVTIIVLLILAGVSIATLTGDNGILTRAQDAKNQTEEAEDIEKIRLAVSEAQIGENEYQELNQSNLQETIDNQFEGRDVVVSDNGDGTFTVSCLDTLKDYIISGNNIEEGIDWSEAMANAVAPESQDEERNEGAIGIGTDGSPVDMDNWDYIILDNGTFGLNSIKDISGGSASWKAGYLGEYTENGEIEGTVPTYISIDEGKTFQKVTETTMTFYNCKELKVMPELPSTITSTYYTFYECSNLEKVKSIPSNVTNMEGIFLVCSKLSELPAIPNGVTNLTSAFSQTAIETMPEIPDSVRVMKNTFGSCTNLKNTTKLPENLETMGMCFHSCTSLKIAPKIPSKVTNMASAFMGCTLLQALPEIPEGVVDMTSTFQGCTSLSNIDIKIPSSVKNLSHTFREDINLNGKITIEAIPNEYANCFYNTSTNENAQLIISGPEENREILTNIIATKSSNSNIKGDWE